MLASRILWTSILATIAIPIVVGIRPRGSDVFEGFYSGTLPNLDFGIDVTAVKKDTFLANVHVMKDSSRLLMCGDVQWVKLSPNDEPTLLLSDHRNITYKARNECVTRIGVITGWGNHTWVVWVSEEHEIMKLNHVVHLKHDSISSRLPGESLPMSPIWLANPANKSLPQPLDSFSD